MRPLSLSGLAFVVCFAAAVAVYGSGAGSDPSSIAAYYADPSDRQRQIAGFAVLLVGCVLLLVYVAVLARELDEPLASVALVGGGASALLLALANALWAASAFTVEIERNYELNASTHLLLEDTGFGVFATAMAFAIPFVACISTRQPSWLAALGGLSAIGLAAAYWYWPVAVFLVWVACGSALGQPRAAAARTRR